MIQSLLNHAQSVALKIRYRACEEVEEGDINLRQSIVPLQGSAHASGVLSEDGKIHQEGSADFRFRPVESERGYIGGKGLCSRPWLIFSQLILIQPKSFCETQQQGKRLCLALHDSM